MNIIWAQGELHRDCVVVLRYQGPRANGMPELHELTPALGVLQDQGYRVALVTDIICIISFIKESYYSSCSSSASS